MTALRFPRRTKVCCRWARGGWNRPAFDAGSAWRLRRRGRAARALRARGARRGRGPRLRHRLGLLVSDHDVTALDGRILANGCGPALAWTLAGTGGVVLLPIAE